MSVTEQVTITLPTEIVRLVREKVANGTYASESDVIREGLSALQDKELEIETWLREHVAPTYDAYKANPERAVPLQAVVDDITQFMDEAEQNEH
jgi:antitoxin ParD1/3/4